MGYYYVRLNKTGQKEKRITKRHPAIGQYKIQVSKRTSKARAHNLCDLLNADVMVRERIKDRFEVAHNVKTARYVVMRKVLLHDLAENIEK